MFKNVNFFDVLLMVVSAAVLLGFMILCSGCAMYGNKIKEQTYSEATGHLTSQTVMKNKVFVVGNAAVKRAAQKAELKWNPKTQTWEYELSNGAEDISAEASETLKAIPEGLIEEIFKGIQFYGTH